MRKRNIVICFVVLAGGAASGCGTAINVAMQPGLSVPPVYGGVQGDVKMATWGFRGGPFPQNNNGPTRCLLDFFGACCLLDMPLSAAADTLTLPYTLWVKFGRHGGVYDKPESPAITQADAPQPASP